MKGNSMPNISDMNIILGQASAIKQMQPVPPLAAEHNAELAAQAAAIFQKREQGRVRQVKAGEEAALKKESRHRGAAKNETTRRKSHSSDNEKDTGRIVDIKI
jgi:hypothetical protein